MVLGYAQVQWQSIATTGGKGSGGKTIFLVFHHLSLILVHTKDLQIHLRALQEIKELK